MFGNAETLGATWKYGVTTQQPIQNPVTDKMHLNTDLQVDFSKPLHGDPDTRLNLSLFQTLRDYTLVSSHQQAIRGFTAMLKVILVL